jgi:hypothetical protein
LLLLLLKLTTKQTTRCLLHGLGWLKVWKPEPMPPSPLLTLPWCLKLKPLLPLLPRLKPSLQLSKQLLMLSKLLLMRQRPTKPCSTQKLPLKKPPLLLQRQTLTRSLLLQKKLPLRLLKLGLQ